MTTGRINQVTILNATAERHGETLAELGQSSSLRGGIKPQQAGPRSVATTGPTGYPFAPTEFPKGRSAAQEVRHLSLIPECDISPSRGGYRLRSTLKADDCIGLPPNVCVDSDTHRAVIYRPHQSLPSRSQQVVRCPWQGRYANGIARGNAHSLGWHWRALLSSAHNQQPGQCAATMEQFRV